MAIALLDRETDEERTEPFDAAPHRERLTKALDAVNREIARMMEAGIASAAALQNWGDSAPDIIAGHLGVNLIAPGCKKFGEEGVGYNPHGPGAWQLPRLLREVDEEADRWRQALRNHAERVDRAATERRAQQDRRERFAAYRTKLTERDSYLEAGQPVPQAVRENLRELAGSLGINP